LECVAIGGYIAAADASFGEGKKPAGGTKEEAWSTVFCGTARPSKPKPTGVTGEGVRCIVAESLESLRTSWGVGGEEMAGVDATLEVRERSANDGTRAGAGHAGSAALLLLLPLMLMLLSFSNETSAPDELRPSMV